MSKLSVDHIALQVRQDTRSDRPTYGAEVELVTLPVSVVDSADFPVGDLTNRDFTIVDEGTEHEVAILLNPHDTPLEIVLLVDLSGSMDTNSEAAREAALSFLEQLSTDDCVLYIPFSTSVTTWGWNHPGDRLLKERIRDATMEGGTRLYDALVESLSNVGGGRARCMPSGGGAERDTANQRRRQALVVVTDGLDAHSVLTFDHALSAARQVDSPVFPVAIGRISWPGGLLTRFSDPGSNPNPGGVTPLRAQSQLKALARTTGGQFISGGRSPDSLRRAYSDVLRWLRSYYVVGYYAETKDLHLVDPELPVWHEVEVRLRRRGYQSHTRPGYFRFPTDAEQARYHINEGIQHATDGLPADALREFDQAIRCDPYNWEAHYRRGGALVMLGDARGAQEAFLRAIEVNPGWGNLHKMAYLVSMELKDHETAWEQAILAHQAGADMTEELQSLKQTGPAPADLEDRMRARRLYVVPTFVADPVANVALRRMLRSFRLALLEAPRIGLTAKRQNAEYELIVQPGSVSNERPRKLDADLLLVTLAGEQVYQRRLLLSDLDDQTRTATELKPHVDALQRWLLPGTAPPLN
jgi:VWFA-related protein